MLTIYKASAGSGKTYTLAFEYIKALLGVKDPETGRYALNAAGKRRRANRHRGILAITFTNKATDEMKSRIVRELNSLATDAASAAYTEKLCGLYGCTPGALSAEAAAALTDMLSDYQNFHVSTIDSFFQMVLRSFARELDQQGDYEVELNDRYAVAAGVGMLFDDLNFGDAPEEKRIRAWVADFMRARISAGQSYNVFDRSGSLAKEVVGYVQRMCGEDFKPHANGALAYLEHPDALRRYCKDAAAMRTDALRNAQQTASAALTAVEAEPGGHAILNATFGRMLATTAAGRLPDADKFGLGNPDKALTFKKILAGTDEKSIYKTSALPKIKKTTVFPPAALTEQLREAAAAMLEAHMQVIVSDMVLRSARALEFLGLAWQYVADFRRDNNLVLMSDTNDLLRRVINGAEVPFIYERIGMELHHFLIDEFQDTSVMQWDNLKPLLANSLADRHDSLIIGDEKQAIYRFRNSDSSLLHHRVANSDFPDCHTERGADPADNTNHRSAHGIVRFNNALFSRLAGEFAIPGYENVRQYLSAKFNGVESFVTARPYEDAAQALEEMAEEIIAEHSRGYAWGRIAVLTRTRAEVQTAVDYLMRNHPEVPVLSNEGLRLDSCASVRQIVSVLKFVDRSYTPDPDNKGFASYADILLLLSRYEFALAHGHDDPVQALFQAVDTGSTDEIVREALDVREAGASTLSGLIEVIISRNIPPEQRSRDFAYIAAFHDVVLDYCRLYNPSVHAFLSWWTANSSKLTVGASAELDAVNIMTIHKAKGLEWDCVHLPLVSWSMKSAKSEHVWIPAADIAVGQEADRPPVLGLSPRPEWADLGSPFAEVYERTLALQHADKMNMTYVAFTRPVRELHIHYKPASAIGKSMAAALGSVHPSDASPEGLDLTAHTDSDGAYSCGGPTAPLRRDAVDTGAIEAPTYEINFRDDTRELTTVDDILADIDDEKPSASDPTGQAREAAADRGTDLHNILAQMRFATELPQAVGMVAHSRKLDAEVAADYRRTLAEAFAAGGELVARWFGPDVRVMAEQNIYVAARDENFRPDRVVFYPDGSADVVDYKFTSEHNKSHGKQVRHYLALLRSMGHTRVRGFLWYPAERLIMPVD